MGNAASKKRLSNIISDHEKGKDKRDNNGPNSVSATSKDNSSVETNSRNVNNAISTLNNNINKLEDNSNNNNNSNNGNLMSPSTSMEPILLRSSNDNNENNNNNNNNNNKGNSNGNSNNSSNSNIKRTDSIGSSLANTLSYGISSTFSGNSTNSSSSYNNNNISLPTSPTSLNERMKSIDIDDMIQRLLMVGYSNKVSKSVCLKNAEIQSICQAAREVFLSQPTLIELTPPVKIVGDVHGQYSDLIRLFDMCGFPPNANYLFLGDYVDRGKQSLETILLLLCYKIKYPENFFLLRGNHECANVTRVYGFYDECKRRSNIKTWKTFVDVFNCLPIAAVVANKIFCVHGGLSPDLSSMDEIRSIRRPTEIPDYGLLNDLLWSDPSETAIDWEDNERGVSYCFGKAIIHDFLNRHDFDLVCRAHMVVEDGYEFFNERTLVTVFSAPNYCGEFDNFGAVMSVNEELLCSFELLKPLDASMIKQQQSKSKRRLSTNLGPHSPPVTGVPQSV